MRTIWGWLNNIPEKESAMTEKLKPCPFCGSKATSPLKTQAKCSNNTCPMSSFMMHDVIWNIRPSLTEAEARKIAESRSYDILTMDIDEPEMNVVRVNDVITLLMEYSRPDR